jgi:hypothetical protein
MSRPFVPSVVLVILAPIAIVFLPLEYGIPVAVFSVLLLFFTEAQATDGLRKEVEGSKPEPRQVLPRRLKSRPPKSELEK